MRDIKFRQWTRFNDWHHWGYLEKDCFTNPMDKTNAESKSYQFTGIKDKNGVDVYEGDIVFVSIKGGSTYTGEIAYFNDFGIYGIAMQKRFGYLSADKNKPIGSNGSATSYKPYNWKSFRSIEVIGNVHENPELLETKEDS